MYKRQVLDCSTVVLGGEVAELLGDALLDALNARLEELCLCLLYTSRCV